MALVALAMESGLGVAVAVAAAVAMCGRPRALLAGLWIYLAEFGSDHDGNARGEVIGKDVGGGLEGARQGADDDEGWARSPT